MNNRNKNCLLLAGTLLALTACNSASQSQEEESTETKATQSTVHEATTPVDKADTADWITMGEYKFKLDPDIQKNGEAHLDFYVHDSSDAHVLGVKGTFHITMPDGTKKTLVIEEEKPYEHYHGKLMLEQFGEYQIVAQTTVKDQKFNPRFTFTRKQ